MSLPPVSVQKSLIGGDLHATMLLILLFGIYTVVYLGTVYLYTHRKAVQSVIVICAITALYGFSLGQLCLQWYFAELVFVDSSDTLQSMFLVAGAVPGPVLMAGNVLQYCGFIVADALLIWRCFHLCNRSFGWIAVLLFLLISEIVLSIVANVVLNRAMSPDDDGTEGSKFNILNGSLAVVIAATSLIATSIIAYRINTATSYDVKARHRYRHIVEMLIQSSVIYSVTMIVVAIVDFVPSPWVTQALAVMYLSAFVYVITGLIPTLMVARIALSAQKGGPDSDSDISTYQISGLQFQNSSAPLDNNEASYITSTETRNESKERSHA